MCLAVMLALGRRSALIISIVIGVSSSALAQGQPAASDHAAGPSAVTGQPASPPEVLTGKERLGEKWKDEQRIDNCNVPLDKRGPKPRPDTCPGAPAG